MNYKSSILFRSLLTMIIVVIYAMIPLLPRGNVFVTFLFLLDTVCVFGVIYSGMSVVYVQGKIDEFRDGLLRRNINKSTKSTRSTNA